MARRNLSPTASHTDLPLRLADVDIVTETDDGKDATRIEGAAVAALLDVAADTERLLDPEDISLELDHVADVLGALAEHAQSPTAGALFLAEHCLRRLAARVDALRPGVSARARRFVIATTVREVLRDYTARPAPSALPHLPHLFARPLPSPVERHERIARARLGGRTNLDQILDFESRATKQPDPVAVREMEFDARIARPLDAVHAEGRA
jgi:hypothetical protein